VNTADFIARCGKNSDRYDYSLVDYKFSNKKVIIICREHGPFKQIPAGHLDGKEGCKKCLRLTQVKLGMRLPEKVPSLAS